jgi:hypothetical protein
MDPVLEVRLGENVLSLEGEVTGRFPAADFFPILKKLLKREGGQAPFSKGKRSQSPPFFTGGFVGYFGYEAADLCDKIKLRAKPGADVPRAYFGLYRNVIVYDHRKRVYHVAINTRGTGNGPNTNQSKRSGDWGRPNYHNGKEIKSLDGSRDLGAKVRFVWDYEHLYFVAKVDDDDVVAKRTGRHIWRDDLLEIYVDPEGDGLFWNDPRDFQLGFRPGRDDRELAVWSWFQGGEDPLEGKKVHAKSYTDATGYIIEGAIRWDFLGVTPEPGKEIRLSPAVHEIDRKGGDGKLVWFFRDEEKYQRFVLGKIILVQEKEMRNADAPKSKT